MCYVRKLSLLNTSRLEICKNRDKLNEAISVIGQLNTKLQSLKISSESQVLHLNQVLSIFFQCKSTFDRAGANIEVLSRHLRTIQIPLNKLSSGNQ